MVCYFDGGIWALSAGRSGLKIIKKLGICSKMGKFFGRFVISF